jgi:hypothetical protein
MIDHHALSIGIMIALGDLIIVIVFCYLWYRLFKKMKDNQKWPK